VFSKEEGKRGGGKKPSRRGGEEGKHETIDLL